MVQVAGRAARAVVVPVSAVHELGGLEATPRIRKLPGCADVPILAVTATAFAEGRKSCLASGMNDFIAKPVAPGELLSPLLRWPERGSR